MDVATVGEVRRTEFAFVAELRSLAASVRSSDRAAHTSAGCSADLGDARCGDRRSPGRSTRPERRSWRSNGRGQFHVAADATFANGLLHQRELRGAAAARRCAIKLHARSSTATAMCRCGRAGAVAFAAGDARRACARAATRRLATCRDEIRQIVNFRGFPHMPGNDVVLVLCQCRRRADGRREPVSMSALTAVADRRARARLDRHALSASGLAARRRLRLPRPRARRLARSGRPGAGRARPLFAGLGGGRRRRDSWRSRGARHFAPVRSTHFAPATC